MGFGGRGKSGPSDVSYAAHEEDTESADGSESAGDIPLTGNDLEQDGQGDEEEGMDDILSPFGVERFTSAAACWQHAERVHGFSYSALRRKCDSSWTDFHQIKLVNHLRKMGPDAARREAQFLDAKSVIWGNDELLLPVLEDDRLLFEGDDEFDDFDMPVANTIAKGESCSTESELSRLRSELHILRNLLGESEESGSGGITTGSSAAREASAASGRSFAFHVAPKVVHLARGESALFEGRTVLDVNCNSGSLACLCTRLGAQSIVGVDSSVAALAVAKEMVTKNGLQGAVRLALSSGEGRIPSPIGCGDTAGPSFDTVVSERLLGDQHFGPCLFSLLAARDRHLRPGGRVLPAKARLNICGAELLEAQTAHDAWLELRAGEPLAGLQVLDPLDAPRHEVRPVCAAALSSQPIALPELDLSTCSLEEALPGAVAFQLDLLPERCTTSLLLFWDIGSGAEFTVSGAPEEAQGHASQSTQTVLHLRQHPQQQSLRLHGEDCAAIRGVVSASMSADGGVELQLDLSKVRRTDSEVSKVGLFRYSALL